MIISPNLTYHLRNKIQLKTNTRLLLNTNYINLPISFNMKRKNVVPHYQFDGNKLTPSLKMAKLLN